MDRERTNSLIDRALRDELSVKPSGDFHARLNEALALERERETRPRWWIVAGVLGAAAAAVIAVVLLRTPVRIAPPATGPAPQIATRSPLPTGPLVSAPAAPSPNVTAPMATARPASAVAPGPATQLPEVEVIVPKGQVEALKRFADDLNDNAAKGRWIPVLAGGAPGSGFYVFPSAPTIDQLPMVPTWDSIERD